MEETDKGKQLAFPFQVIEQEIMNPLNGHQMSDLESYVASLLLEATSEEPMKMIAIIAAVAEAFGESLSPRKVKILVRNLRRERRFPILTRRSKPAGYFWCRSEKELKEFSNMWLRQVMDELTTLSMITKSNFPKLAGQKMLLAYTREE